MKRLLIIISLLGSINLFAMNPFANARPEAPDRRVAIIKHLLDTCFSKVEIPDVSNESIDDQSSSEEDSLYNEGLEAVKHMINTAFTTVNLPPFDPPITINVQENTQHTFSAFTPVNQAFITVNESNVYTYTDLRYCIPPAPRNWSSKV